MIKFKRKLKLIWYNFELLSIFSLLLIICLLPVPLINGGEDDGIILNRKLLLPECQCQYDSLKDLIIKSPIIIKALGAKIFNDKLLFNFERNKQINENSENINNNNNKIIFNTRKKDNLVKFIDKNTNNNNNNNNFNFNKICSNNNNNNNNLNIITLTPETIYKGASILKIDSQADKISKFYLNDSFRRRRQLNAEFGPIECFNQGTFNLLPTQLIVFGKLISNNNNQQQQQQQQNYNNFDTLQIYPNGIHLWSPELENYIWKHLGWDNWSDFTLCSVTCGKGVQQRFRRCLFDNVSTSSSSSSAAAAASSSLSTSSAVSTFSPITFVNNNSNKNSNNNQNGMIKESFLQQSQQQQQKQIISQNSKDFMNNYQQEISSEYYGLHNNFRFNFDNNESIIKHKNKMINGRKLKLLKNKNNHKKRKTTKGMTTLSCEGYNIEQRNCNMFECDDYLTDLLKFSRRTFSDSTTSSPSLPSSFASEMSFDQIKSTIGLSSTGQLSSSSSSSSSASASGIQLQNSGFIQGWQNSINFTIMITLKLKAPRQSTIFELRNSTHNLYLDQSDNGLKLFQERDEVTEMLPIKFDLYDNRWHQIAISVFNGDFITMYVDCLWTNSFVVSKHLFALPLNADVEIGREYAGDEIQQLLILPGNREKQQCSAERTSINEVKRYIIDTFIEDYGN